MYSLDKAQYAPEMNRNNLIQILSNNRNTKIGRKYAFDEIDSYDSYKRRVPISDYHAFEDSINAMFNGEDDLLTAFPIIGFAKTSATSGGEKRYPVSQEALERLYRANEMQRELLHFDTGRSLMISSFRINYDGQEDRPCLITAYIYRQLFQKGFLDFDMYVGDRMFLFAENDSSVENLLYTKAWIALLSSDIVMIESIFRYEILKFFNFLKYHWKEILNDIKSGKVSEQWIIPESQKRELLAMDFSEERLNYIETECSKGFENIAKRLWPNLKLLTGIASKSMILEDKNIRYYTGDVNWNYWMYAATEGALGRSRLNNSYDYQLLPEVGFMELLPTDDNSEGGAILPEEAVIGQKYEIIFTSFSGVYRYRMGDVLLVTDMVDDFPVIEFLYRRGYMLNASGEKVTNDQLTKTIITSAHKCGCNITDFCAAVQPERERYQIVLSCGDNSNVNEKELARSLDEGLMEANADYRDLREKGYFHCLETLTLGEMDFYRFAEEHKWPLGNGKSKNLVYQGFDERIWEHWKTKITR